VAPQRRKGEQSEIASEERMGIDDGLVGMFLVRRISTTLSALLLLLVTGCGCSSETRRPNVLLISLDTLRADHLGCYGYNRRTSPFLDELASTGLLFTNAFVNSHSTGTSHTTLLSGLYQETHRVQWEPREYGLHKGWTVPASVRMLQEILREEGYDTIGVTEGGYVGRKFGFARGFTKFRDDQPRDIQRTTDVLLELVRGRQHTGRPLFLFLHTYQVHAVYGSPEHYRQKFADRTEIPGDGNLWKRVAHVVTTYMNRAEALDGNVINTLRSLYDAAIRYSDETLRDFFNKLSQLGFFENYLIVITADHGEEFGEHGGLQHRGVLFEELIHVPLILKGTRVPAGRRQNELVGSVDVAPTILKYCGIEPPARMPGRDLLTDRHPRQFIFAQYGNIAYAVRGYRWKFIKAVPLHEGASLNDPFERMLFDLENDPGERRNVADERPEIARRLESQLEMLLAASSSSVTPEQRRLSNEEIDRLRSLGYLR